MNVAVIPYPTTRTRKVRLSRQRGQLYDHQRSPVSPQEYARLRARYNVIVAEEEPEPEPGPEEATYGPVPN